MTTRETGRRCEPHVLIGVHGTQPARSFKTACCGVRDNAETVTTAPTASLSRSSMTRRSLSWNRLITAPTLSRHGDANEIRDYVDVGCDHRRIGRARPRRGRGEGPTPAAGDARGEH